MKVECPKCHKEITAHPKFGAVWCADCTRELGRMPSRSSREWVDDQTKEDRLKYKEDIVQPYRGDTPSQEFIEAHPKEANKMFTPEQRKKSDYVWRDTPGFKRKHGKKMRIRI